MALAWRKALNGRNTQNGNDTIAIQESLNGKEKVRDER